MVASALRDQVPASAPGSSEIGRSAFGVTGDASRPFQYAMRFEFEGRAWLPFVVDDHGADGLLLAPALAPGSLRVSALLRGLGRPGTSAELAGEGLTVQRLARVIRGTQRLGHPS
jgi:hypothetical protein